MLPSDVFWAVPVAAFAIDRNRVLVVNRPDGAVVETDVIAARALASCQGIRTLEEHIANIIRSGVTANPEAVASAVERLISLRLLRRWDGIARRTSVNDRPGLVDTISVITADRPRSLSRCLDFLALHLRSRGHSPRILVVDGSRNSLEATKAVVTRAAVSFSGPCEYIGPREAMRLRQALRAIGLAREVLDFGLTPGGVGSNRNLVLLLTAGERVVMVDDDVMWEPWALQPTKPGFALVGHEDPEQWDFFNSRPEALASTHRCDTDILTALGACLGRRLIDLVADEELDSRDACQHILGALHEPNARHIRVTVAGLAGDSGVYCPRRLLFSKGALQNALLRDPKSLAMATSSREVHRVARQASITHDSTCMSYCIGLDNRSVLPPFIPTGRNEDGLFGVMLHAMDESALRMHLPVGVVHDSERPSRYSSEQAMPSARENRISEMIICLIQASQVHTWTGTQSERLSRLSTTLREALRTPPRTFAMMLSEEALLSRARDLLASDNILSRRGDESELFRRAVEEYRQTVVESAKAGRFTVAAELATTSNLDLGVREQQFIGAFQSLVDGWEELWQAARQIQLERPQPAGPRAN